MSWNIYGQRIASPRGQIRAQRSDILKLEHAGIPAGSAQELLGIMENRVDEFCAQHWSERVMRHSDELDVANIIRNTLIGEDRDYQ